MKLLNPKLFLVNQAYVHTAAQSSLRAVRSERTYQPSTQFRRWNRWRAESGRATLTVTMQLGKCLRGENLFGKNLKNGSVDIKCYVKLTPVCHKIWNTILCPAISLLTGLKAISIASSWSYSVEFICTLWLCSVISVGTSHQCFVLVFLSHCHHFICVLACMRFIVICLSIRGLWRNAAMSKTISGDFCIFGALPEFFGLTVLTTAPT